MALTTINTLPPAVQQHFDKKLLAVHVPQLIYGLGVARKELPANSGRFLRMGRYSNFPLALIPLDNLGSTPPAVTTVRTDIDAEIQFYGKPIVAALYAIVKSVLIDLEAYSA